MATLPAGEYYIGDPCYAIPDVEWDQFITDWDAQLGEYGRDQDGGVFQYKGLNVFVHHTAFGDGEFDGYGVDSGSIGAVPAALVGAQEREEIMEHNLGTFFTFTSDFVVGCVKGEFQIGHIHIDTNY